MMLHDLPIRFLLCSVLAAAPAIAEGPAAESIVVPSPDLSALETGVARQIEERQKVLRDLAESDPNPREIAAAWADLGAHYHAYKLIGPAEEAYRKAQELDPEDARWPHLLGGLLQDAGRLDEAATAYRRAVELAPQDLPALVHLGEIHLLQGRREEAEEALRKVLVAEPANAAANALLGQAALERGAFREAADRLEAALRAVPGANRLHYPLSRAYRGLGEADRAAEHLGKSGSVGVRAADPVLDGIESLRTGERARLDSGKRAYNAGRHAEAAEEFRRALESCPDSVEARINLAAALVQQGDRSGAISRLREAVELAPANPTARFNLGLLLAGDGPSPEAIEHLGAAVAARPQDAEARREWARLLRDAGRLQDAAREYAQVVKDAPADEAARLGRAETWIRAGRFAEARAFLEEDLKAMPQSGLVTHGLARLLAGCPDLSVRDGARALELALVTWNARPIPAHAETVAMSWAELGRCEEAARWQRTAVELAEKGGYPKELSEPMKKTAERYGSRKGCRP